MMLNQSSLLLSRDSSDNNNILEIQLLNKLCTPQKSDHWQIMWTKKSLIDTVKSLPNGMNANILLNFSQYFFY